MAFGQQSGPPATHKQVQQLSSLILAAGHSDFRDARGPLGLTQRQAGGKFTRDEADELIDRLEREAEDPSGTPDTADDRPDPRDVQRRATARKLPSEILAAELQSRGWVVMEP